MNKSLLLLAGGLLAANFAVPVCAEEGYGSGMGMEKSGMGMEKMEKMEMEKGKHKMMGWHKMSGTVDNIDYAKGMLTLKSGAPDMMLHFPPASIKDLKNGDTITVDLGFAKGDRTKKMD